VFDLVARYSAYAHHRTGTANDHEVAEWLATVLRADGAIVELNRSTFPQWTAEWSAELDGSLIDSLPVFYEISESGSALVVATAHPNGRLYVNNRRPTVEQVANLTLNVAGCYAARTDDIVTQIGNVRVLEGTSANVTGSWPGSQPKVIVATPISGWFSCASERGGGIAVARHLALSLVGRGHAVALWFTSGHELFNIGLTHELSRRQPQADAIVHVGASVTAASGPGRNGFSDQLMVTSNIGGCGTSLGRLGFMRRHVGLDTKDWIGEARQWKNLGLPLLSAAGASEWFHTPDDTASNATSTQLLDAVSAAFFHDVVEFLERRPTH
jgi:hypothetical protein